MSEIPELEYFPEYAATELQIVTKEGDLKPFQLNIYQRKLEACYQYQKERNLPIRLIQLKARQVGGSTYGAGKMFHLATTEPFHRCFIMAHDDESTDNIFEMVKTYYDYIDEKIKPKIKYSNKKVLDFRNPGASDTDKDQGLRSAIQVGTAGNKKRGRSKTNRSIHLSECAYWESAGTLITAICQTVPAKPGTFILKESTANGQEGGAGEQFYKDWIKAVNQRSDYIPIFCAWWENPDYEIKYNNDFQPGDNEAEFGDEQTLYNFLKDPEPYQVGITQSLKGFDHDTIMRKLSWRRYKISNDMGEDASLNPLDQYAQEYPATWEEAFISSGRPVFPNKEIQRQITEMSANLPKTVEIPIPLIQDIDQIKEDHNLELKPDLYRQIDGFRKNLVLYELPKPGRLYAIGADISEGLLEGDDSDIRIIDEDYNDVGYWCGKADEDIVGDFIGVLANYFNKALYAIEVNNMGISTQRSAQKKCSNSYMRRIVDKITEDVTLKAGWRTDVKTKDILIIDLRRYYRDGIGKFKDLGLLRQMMSCQREDNGKVNLNGKDKVVARAIAIQAAKELPRVLRPVTFPEREQEDPTRHGTKEEYLKYLDRLARRNETENYDDW